MGEPIPDETLDEWEARAKSGYTYSGYPADIQRLIAAYRASQEWLAGLEAQIGHDELAHQRVCADAEKAEADLAALRAGIEALAADGERYEPHGHGAWMADQLRALLSTSTDQPEGDPCPKHRALGVNRDCPDCDQPEGDS